MTGTEWIAGELIEDGLCSARCLLALGDGPCDCACGGRWHGALTGADAGEGIPPVERARMREEARAAAVVRRGAVPVLRIGRRGRPPLDPSLRGDYPGAPVGDPRAFQSRHAPDGTAYAVPVGMCLREHGAALVLAALRAVPEGSPVRIVCREANRARASRPDLAGYRYLSTAACARIMRDLRTKGTQ